MSDNMDFYKDLPEDEKESILDAAGRCGHNDKGIEFIGMDDTFDFQCQQCGACCMNRGDIILSGWDVFKAAKYLGITCSEFLEKYTIRTLGNYSKMPMVLLKTEQNGFCPFLKFDYLDDGKFKCTINPAKPGACASHPIGMVSSMSTEHDINDPDVEENIETSFIKVTQCPQSQGHNEMHVVREWMSHFLDNKEESLKAHELSIMSAKLVNWPGFFLLTAGFAAGIQNADKVSMQADMLMKAYSMTASLLIEYAYAHFDTDRDFSMQVDENREFLVHALDELGNHMYGCMEELFNDCSDKTLIELLNEGQGTDYSEQAMWLLRHPLRYSGVSMEEAAEMCGEEFDPELWNENEGEEDNE